MKKKTSFILAVVLAFTSLTACSNESEHKKANNQTPSTEQPAPTVFVPVKPILVTADPSNTENMDDLTGNYIKYNYLQEPIPAESIVNRQEIDWTNPNVKTAMEAYKSTLLDITDLQKPLPSFIKNTNQSHFSDYFGTYARRRLSHFSLIDLDRDQIPEVILFYEETYKDQVAILRYYDNHIYAYLLDTHSVIGLNIDGTFSSCGTTYTSPYNRISFNDTTCMIERYTYYYNSDFYINGTPSTEEAYFKAVHEEYNKKRSSWYDFTKDNIENYCSYSYTNEKYKKLTEPIAKESVSDRQIIDWTNPDVITAMTAYKSVLKNISHLSETAPEWIEYIDNCQSSIFFSISGLLTHFTIIDLDKDQIPEVVLAFGSKTNQDQFAILHYCDNTVYAYSLGIRSFNDLKIDGTFRASGNAFETSYNTISFNGVIHIIEAYTHNNWDSSYYVYGKQSTEEEYYKAIQEEDQKLPVAWYDYSLENIDTYFRK